MDGREAIGAITQRLKKCPPSLVSWTVSEDKYGMQLTVLPTTNDLCPFTIEFGPSDYYGLSFGHGLHFENISISEFDPVAVAEAIMHGAVSERLWLLFGRLNVRTEGSIQLKDCGTLSDKMLGFPAPSCLVSEEQIDYRAYPEVF